MTQEEDDFGADDSDYCRDHVTDHLSTALAALSLSKSSSHPKHHTKPASTSSIQRRRLPQAEMPKLTNLDQLTLHSPSTQLVGTPFATDSTTKYEYPFPDDSSSCSASGSSSTRSTPPGPILSPPLSSGIFPLISATASPAHLSLPCLIQSGHSSSSSSTTSSTTSFTPIVHTKLKPPTNPPIPPSLVKKRPKWSVGGRRRNGHESQNEAFYDGDHVIEHFLRSDYGDGVLIPHSSRDDSSRNEH